MSYWPTELYQYDALNQLYGPNIQDSPLRRAFQLHHTNIKQGEQLLLQISQQGQPGARNNDSGPAENGNEQEESAQRAADSQDERVEEDDTDNEVGGNQSNPSKGDMKMNSSDSVNHSRNVSSSQSSKDTDSGHNAEQQQQQPPLLEYNSQQLDNLREASTEIRQNLLRLNVYLADLSVVKHKQMPAYGMEDLFADIGGTLGLWMGVSVLTIMELLELIVRISHLFLRAEWRPSAPGPGDEQQPRVGDRNGDIIDTTGKISNVRTRERAYGGGDLSERDRELQIFGSREIVARDRSAFEGVSAEQQRQGTGEADSEKVDTLFPSDRVYSYRTEADYRRSDGLHEHYSLVDRNGLGSLTPGSDSVLHPPRDQYSGRTKYWRLKRGKIKTWRYWWISRRFEWRTNERNCIMCLSYFCLG